MQFIVSNPKNMINEKKEASSCMAFYLFES